MVGGKISKLVIVITDKDTGEHVERWQFDVGLSLSPSSLLPCAARSLGHCILTYLPPPGPNLPTAPEIQVLQVRLETRSRPTRPRKRIPRRCRRVRATAARQQDRGRDPGRNRRHLPPDHRFRHLPAPAQRRLHLQRARLRRRRLGRARRVGRLGRKGDCKRRARPAARLQHREPSRRHHRELPPRRLVTRRRACEWRMSDGRLHDIGTRARTRGAGCRRNYSEGVWRIESRHMNLFWHAGLHIAISRILTT